MEILKRFEGYVGGGDDMDTFLKLFELPDNQFDAIYPDLKKQIKEIFSSEQYRNDMLKTLKEHPIENFEREKEEVESFVEDIRAEEGLSNNKKDMLIELMNSAVLSSYEIFSNPREKVTVEIVKMSEDAVVPVYAHDTDAGADIYAVEDTLIKAGDTVIVKTGIKVAIPNGYEIQIRPRSGMSAKTKIRIANAPGTIDSEYRGEIGVIMDNIGTEDYTIKKGEKIAQMVIAPSFMISWNEVSELDSTDRGEGGFGSTGK